MLVGNYQRKTKEEVRLLIEQEAIARNYGEDNFTVIESKIIPVHITKSKIIVEVGI